MPIETVPFDSAQHLKTEADIARYLAAVLEANDPDLRRHAPGQVARAKGMTRLAREVLYRALSADGNPELATVKKVMKSLGLHLSAESATP